MQIRPAVASDAAGIAAVHVTTWRQAYRGLLPDAFLDGLDPARWTAGWERVLGEGDDDHVTLVADDGGLVIGFADVLPSRDDDAPAGTGEVSSIYASPERWGTGTGRALMAEAEEQLRRRGFTTATLWVLRDNERARRFYERAGWLADASEKADVVGGVPVVEVRYRRSL